MLAGLPVALAVLTPAGIPPEAAEPLRADGDRIEAGAEVLRIAAPMRELLGAERTLLNFLTHLSGIATATSAWADALAGTGCTVRDTRKTTPGLRQLEKYAVRCGGGRNHRMGLGDAALIKDNHVAAAGGIAAAIAAVRAAAPGAAARGGVRHPGPGPRGPRRPAPASSCSTTWTWPTCAPPRPWPAATPRTQLEASGGLRLETARAVAADRRRLRRRRRPDPLQPRARPRAGPPGLVTSAVTSTLSRRE